ncbi:YihY/virulence factor BrkB family protein [Nocardioides rotundus]|uniref:YihY/virulence factor BrkB family protein n=1 Tax=Nocardioides rotundus TaxID=1774216 RepID=UPI001CBB450C|nr:YhjD/YihY/BrkB family envelope integrity protein [Nocardioides rotundus]UAL28703.1 YihY/virulence factor BrkB family protein [Nocardioides rotundus]
MSQDTDTADEPGRLDRLRASSPVLDHIVRTVQHYGSVKGNALAGAVTYFGFLSFFPIMALTFAVVGWIARYAGPDLVDTMVKAIQSILPLVVQGKAQPGEISIEVFQDAAGAAAGIGAITALYSGLGWLSGMREAMMLTFEMPQDEQPNFVFGKLRDLASLIIIGGVLLLSVAIAGAISFASTWLLDLVGLGEQFSPVLRLLSIGVGILANSVLFFTVFRLLANPPMPRRALVGGALLGAVGFELLKQLATILMKQTASQPAFAVFGIALILVVWINYFSRLLVYSASWAHTSPAARLARERAAEPETLEERIEAYRLAPVPAAPVYVEREDPTTPTQRAATATAAGVAGLVAGLILGRRGR